MRSRTSLFEEGAPANQLAYEPVRYTPCVHATILLIQYYNSSTRIILYCLMLYPGSVCIRVGPPTSKP